MRRIGTIVALVLSSSLARAAGFETPDNGAEALGRGGAFTAKASDATALQYNVAGLANQRGTRALFDGKLSINNYSFQRNGVYPDSPSDPATPWGKAFFPTVTNQGAPFFAPFLGVSSDLGRFDRLTVAIGAFGPSGVGNPTYPLGVSGAPSPARYDVVQANSVIVLPTIAAAYRLTDWLDVGAAFHYVYGSFDLVNTSFADLAQPAPCKNVEYQPCDTVNHLVMTGSTFTGSGGLMIHPETWWDIGLNARGPISITATGNVTSTPPLVAPAQGVNTAPVTFTTALPWQVRAGTRVKLNEGNFEAGDLEIDGVYEAWSSAQGLGSFVSIPQIGPFKDVNTVILHKYADTVSVRLGGAYNVRTTPESILTFRAGGYFETSPTSPADTRMDFNTLQKIAGTLGAGLTYRGVGINLAYAGVFSPARVVTNGELGPINPVQHGQSIDANGAPLPAVNNGTYTGFIHMLSFGVRVEIETVLGTARSKRWTPQGTLPFDAEAAPTAAPPATEPPKEEAKEEVAPEAKAAVKPAPRPAAKPGAKPSPEPPRRPARPTKQDNDEEKTRRLEDPFAK